MRPIPDILIRRSPRKPPKWLADRLARRFPEVRLIYRPNLGWQLVEKGKQHRHWYHVKILDGEPNFYNTIGFLASCDISTIMANHTLNSFIAENLDAYDPQMDADEWEDTLKDPKIEEGHKRLRHALGPSLFVVPNPTPAEGGTDV